MLLNAALMRALGVSPRSRDVALDRRGREVPEDDDAEDAECIRRFPALTLAGARQGVPPPDGRRGLTLLGAALLRPGIAPDANIGANGVPAEPSLGNRKSGIGECPRERGTPNGDLQCELWDLERELTEEARGGSGRLNPDWLELMLGLPLGWTAGEDRLKAELQTEYADWVAGWMRLEGWKYGPGVWVGYHPGTVDLPMNSGIWERDVPRVTHIRGQGGRLRVLCAAVSPPVMAAAVGHLRPDLVRT